MNLDVYMQVPRSIDIPTYQIYIYIHRYKHMQVVDMQNYRQTDIKINMHVYIYEIDRQVGRQIYSYRLRDIDIDMQRDREREGERERWIFSAPAMLDYHKVNPHFVVEHPTLAQYSFSFVVSIPFSLVKPPISCPPLKGG